MAFPVVISPVLTQSELLDSLIEAEAGVAQCMADFFCNAIIPKIKEIEDIKDQVELLKIILCAYACKEKEMAAVINAIANKTFTDKGLVLRNNDVNR